MLEKWKKLKPGQKIGIFLAAMIVIGMINAFTKSDEQRAAEKNAAANAARIDAIAKRNREFIFVVRYTVKSLLRDPDSAQYRNERVVMAEKEGGTDHVCGEVNSRNGFGGMAGYRRFVADEKSVMIDDGSAKFRKRYRPCE